MNNKDELMNKSNKWCGVAKILIEKISSAIGYLYDPDGLIPARRNLSSALVQKIIDDPNIDPIEKAALCNEISFIIKKHKNRGDIIRLAANLLDEQSKPDSISEDWMFFFFDSIGNASTEMLRVLWANILVHEANHPSSVSKRLIHNISLMSYQDAMDFINLSVFCFYDKKYSNMAHPIIFVRDRMYDYKTFGITEEVLHKLQLFSLVETNYEVGFVFHDAKRLLYSNHNIMLTSPTIPAGYVKLTDDGQTLLSIIEKKNDNNALEFTLQMLSDKNVDVDCDSH